MNEDVIKRYTVKKPWDGRLVNREKSDWHSTIFMARDEISCMCLEKGEVNNVPAIIFNNFLAFTLFYVSREIDGENVERNCWQLTHLRSGGLILPGGWWRLSTAAYHTGEFLQTILSREYTGLRDGDKSSIGRMIRVPCFSIPLRFLQSTQDVHIEYD